MSNSQAAAQMRKTSMQQNRKGSMTIKDLEAIHEGRVHPGNMPAAQASTPAIQKFNEHSEIFEELCEEVDQQVQNEAPTFKKMQRRSSMPMSEEMASVPEETAPPVISELKQRRHSSYESRCRNAHRNAHTDVKELLQKMEDKNGFRRSSFVQNLLELSISVDLSHSVSESEFGLSPLQSIAMQQSCPILSYVNDDEEDSVELAQHKRPSLISTVLLEDDEYFEDSSKEASWETLKDDGAEVPNVREYVITLPPMSAETSGSVKKPRRTRRHSYQMLEKRLEQESPVDLLKSFSSNLQASFASIDGAAPSPPAKSLVDNFSMAEPQRPEPVVRHQQIGRAA